MSCQQRTGYYFTACIFSELSGVIDIILRQVAKFEKDGSIKKKNRQRIELLKTEAKPKEKSFSCTEPRRKEN